MGLGITAGSVFTYLIGLILIFVIGKILLKPLKWILKLIINGLVGGLMLIAVNALTAGLGFSITINPVNALIAGILGVPGVILLILAKLIL